MCVSNPRAGSWLTEPNRRQFLALAAAIAGSPLMGSVPRAQRAKTLAQYKVEANAYAAALTTLSASPSSMATYRSASERVGANLKHRFSWLVTQVAQDSRLTDALKPHFASQAAFSRFATSVAGSATGILNLPGVRQAVVDALAKDAQGRQAFTSAVQAFAALIQKEATRLQVRLKEAEIRVQSRIEDSQSTVLLQRIAVVAVAVVMAAIAVGIAAAIAASGPAVAAGGSATGPAAVAAGSAAALTAAMAAAGATAAMTAVALAAAAARIAAQAAASAATTVAEQAGPSAEAIAACVEAAADRRSSCLSSITGGPGEREAKAAECEANYLAQSAFCSLTA